MRLPLPQTRMMTLDAFETFIAEPEQAGRLWELVAVAPVIDGLYVPVADVFLDPLADADED